jgi:hypothetical protein
MRDHMRTELPLAAPRMATQRQKPPPPGLIHHVAAMSFPAMKKALAGTG